MGASAYPVLFYGYLEEEEYSLTWDKASKRENGIEWEKYADLRAMLGIYDQIAGFGYNERRYLAMGKNEIAQGRYCDEHIIVTPAMLVVHPSWDAWLKMYTDALGLNIDNQQPAWHIVAYYG